jgi:hypothetical protein
MPEVDPDRGLLDLSVEFSTREIKAEKEFTLYVKVRNPFSKPVWVERVHVNLPSELALAADPQTQAQERQLESQRRQVEEEKKKAEEEKRTEAALLRGAIETVSEQFGILNANTSSSSDQEIKEQVRKLSFSLTHIESAIDNLRSAGARVLLHGSEIARAVLPPYSEVALHNDGENKSYISVLEIASAEPNPQVVGREIKLQSSLPPGVSLQPGSTDVYKAVLRARSHIFFAPSNYRLQFNVNFSFDEPGDKSTNISTNTIAHEISIRASVWSLICGAIAGGFSGSLVRLFQSNPDFNIDRSHIPAGIASVFVSMILSMVAVIFVARKSEAQSFVSVEDFWGAFLIGFFVGYTGTSFFDELTQRVLHPPAGAPAQK